MVCLPKRKQDLRKPDPEPKTDPLAAARKRGKKRKENLLRQYKKVGLTNKQVGELLGMTPQEVNRRTEKGTLAGLPDDQGGYLYPKWQFHEGKLIPGLDRVLAALEEWGDWTKLAFLQTGDIRLEGKTPLESLKAGKIKEAINAAECYGKHGAA